MTFNIDLPYVIRPADIENQSYFSRPRQVTEFLARSAFAEKYKEGIKDRTVRRVVRNVLRPLSRAVKENQDYILLDHHEATALKEALETWSVPVPLLDWAEDLLEAVERFVSHDGTAGPREHIGRPTAETETPADLAEVGG